MVAGPEIRLFKKSHQLTSMDAAVAALRGDVLAIAIQTCSRDAVRPLRIRFDGQCQRRLSGVWNENLIRKFTILLLTLMSIGLALLWWLSVSHTYRERGKVCIATPTGTMRTEQEIERHGFEVEFDLGDDVHFKCSSELGLLSIMAAWDFGAPTAGTQASGGWHWNNHNFCFSLAKIGSARLLIVYAPFWFLISVLAVGPIWSFIRGPLRRHRRRKRYLCIHCGYDLTGNVSGDCPECGANVNP